MARPVGAAIAVLGLLLAGAAHGAGSPPVEPEAAPAAPGTVVVTGTEVVRVRLMPREATPGTPPDRLTVTEAYWGSGAALEGERRRDALKVTEDYVSSNLSTWVKGSPLEEIERLRRTDLNVAGGGAGPGAAGDLNIKLRLAEQVRLTVAAESFRRDLTYDPLRRRMWVDLVHFELPDTETGLTLTNTYGWDNEGNRLMLNLRHRFE
jgi:hypothetical protein